MTNNWTSGDWNLMGMEGKRGGPPPQWLVRQMAHNSLEGGLAICDRCGLRFTASYVRVQPRHALKPEVWLCRDCEKGREHATRIETIRVIMGMTHGQDPELAFRWAWISCLTRPHFVGFSDFFDVLLHSLRRPSGKPMSHKDRVFLEDNMCLAAYNEAAKFFGLPEEV